jgi:TonB family protein
MSHGSVASEPLVRDMDAKVHEQVTNVATLPGIERASYAMPDAHWEYGFPIGGLAAFDADRGGVVSAGVVANGRTSGAARLGQRVIKVRRSAFIVACTIGVVLSAQEAYSPARYQAGTLPGLSVVALGGGQVFLELAVGREGRVTAVTPLRTTPLFTDLVVDAVRDWQFLPADQELRKVLVAAVFRPPALTGATLGEAPSDVASASEETAFPLTTSVPPFPLLAYRSGVVLLEVHVDRDGAAADATVIHSAPPFDDAARTAARQWSFRPARVQGTPVSTLVYILFGFPIPVGGGPTSEVAAPIPALLASGFDFGTVFQNGG